MKKERKAENVLEKKAGKRTRVSIKDEEKNMKKNKNENVSDFYAGDFVVEGSDQGSVSIDISTPGSKSETESELDGERGGGGETDTDGQTNNPKPFSLKSASRPGITFERIQNIFDPYVTGIAVRP